MGYSKDKQDLDFVTRTQELLVQYDEMEKDSQKKYEITLLINCFVGLIIVPQSKWNDSISPEEISSERWGIDPSMISICKDGKLVDEPKNLRNVARHLRNSISHYHFEIVNNSNHEIGSIKFQDFLPNNERNETFELTIEIEPLKKFLLKFSEEMIRVMEEEGKKKKYNQTS